MKKKLLFILIFSSLFFGCSEKEHSATPDFSKVHNAADKAFKEVK